MRDRDQSRRRRPLTRLEDSPNPVDEIIDVLGIHAVAPPRSRPVAYGRFSIEAFVQIGDEQKTRRTDLCIDNSHWPGFNNGHTLPAQRLMGRRMCLLCRRGTYSAGAGWDNHKLCLKISMKPRDILLTRIDHYLRVPLEVLGFRYARSKITFSRKTGIAVQEISFQLDRYNSENDCTFWTHWTTRAPAYAKWCDQQFGQHLGNGHLGGAAEWNVPGWSRAVDEHACLRNDDKDEGVMRRLAEDVTRAGIPWIDSISTWHGAAQQLLRENWHFASAADFFLLAEDEASARATILKGIQLYTVGGRFDQSRELPELQLRLAKFFPGAQPSKIDSIAPAQPAATTPNGSSTRDGFLMAAIETAGTAESAVVFDPRRLVRELNAYGEPEAANKITQLEAKELLAIGRRAHAIWSTFSGDHGPTLDKSICLAVVEHIEGSPRELKRKRRQYPEITE